MGADVQLPMKTDLQIHERSLESLAIWEQYKPNFTMGTLTLAAHAAVA